MDRTESGWSRALAGLFLVSLLALPVRSDAQLDPGSVGSRESVYLNTDPSTENHLHRAEAHLANGQWEEAIDIFEHVMENFGDRVVRLAPGRYGAVRTYCHMKIAAMPPEARAIYRQRVDSEAGKWYGQAVARRQAEPLEGLVDRAFASSWGDDALFLLGEMALEQGRYARARALWQKLLPVPPAAEGEPAANVLAYPDSDLDLRQVRARLVLCSLLEGDIERGMTELERFAQLHPNAVGTLAGRQGPLAELLAEVAEAADDWPRQKADDAWPTFAGTPARTKTLPRAVDVGSLQWRAPLEEVRVSNQPMRTRFGARFRRRLEERQLLSYHPLLVDNIVFLNTAEDILAFELNTGNPAWPGVEESDNPVFFSLHPERRERRTPQRQFPGVPYFTMTAYEGRLYARMGTPMVSLPARRSRNVSQKSHLVCVDLASEGKLVWQIDMDGEWAFEGSPVVQGDSVYIALRRSGVMPQARVACYDAKTNRERWSRTICEGSSSNSGIFGDASQNLLTMADGALYYCTNLGAVASLDGRDGAVRWIATYPRENAAATNQWGFVPPARRGLNPCVVANGIVLAAPNDTDSILALDAETGRLLWETDLPKDVVHLLGVGQGNLIASGDRLWAIDLRTGKVTWRFPDYPDPHTKGHGRGVLVDDEVYWPTREEIRVFKQADGRQTKLIRLKQHHSETGGNLLVADGYLLVAQSDALLAFCQYSRLYDRYKEEIAAEPEKAAPHYRLALAAEAMQRWDVALASYRRAIELAGPDDLIAEQPIAGEARAHLYRLLLSRAEAAAKEKSWELAVDRYEDAGRNAPDADGRLAARLRAAATWISAGKPAAAVDVYQTILADARLAGLMVAGSDPLAVRADLLVADRVDELIAEHGRGVYERYDREASEQLEAARTDADAASLERVARRFPNAAVAGQVLLELARLYQDRERPDDAVRTYHRVLARDDANSALRATALFGLATAYEKQQLWPAARRSLSQLARDHPDADLAHLGIDETASRYVAHRLAEAEYAASAVHGTALVQLPLMRHWNKTLSNGALLVPEGPPPVAMEGSLFVGGEGLECVGVDDGRVRWTLPTAEPPLWVGYAADSLLVATPEAITAVALSDGRMIWHFAPGADSGPGNDADLDPNDAKPKSPPAENAGDSEPASGSAGRELSEFVLVGRRLYFRQGDSQLSALSADTGSVVWSFRLEKGRLPVPFHGDFRRVMLQASEPDRLVVLDASDGRIEYELPASGTPWPRHPVALEEGGVCVVADNQRIQLHNLRKRQVQWTLPGPTSPANGPPDVLVYQDKLMAVLNGYVLARVDPATGKAIWKKSIGTHPLSNPRQQAALDADAFYCVSRQDSRWMLEAFRLEDGAMLWKHALNGPQGNWRVVRTADYVVAYPLVASRGEAAQGLPVFFCRPDTGQLAQRLNFPADPSGTQLLLSPGRVLVAAEQALWALKPLTDAP